MVSKIRFERTKVLFPAYPFSGVHNSETVSKIKPPSVTNKVAIKTYLRLLFHLRNGWHDVNGVSCRFYELLSLLRTKV